MTLDDFIDVDFPNFVPKHLQGNGVNVPMVNALWFFSAKPEIYGRLYAQVNSATEDALYKTLDWHLGIERGERRAMERLNIQIERERIRAVVDKIFPFSIGERIDREYTLFLLQEGLPAHKINKWRKFLAGRYGNMLQLFGENIDRERPSGLRMAAYCLTRGIKSMMLKNSSRSQDYGTLR